MNGKRVAADPLADEWPDCSEVTVPSACTDTYEVSPIALSIMMLLSETLMLGGVCKTGTGSGVRESGAENCVSG